MLQFSVGNTVMEFVPRLLVMAGFTGRDRAAIQAHIDELAEKGIRSPSIFPAYYHKLSHNITQTGELEALDRTDHSGEAEYCVFIHQGRYYIAAASDHTDRKAEEHNVLKSKQIYPSVVGREAWAFDEVRDHWDQLLLQGWATVQGERRLYQSAPLSVMLPPDELVDWFKTIVVRPDDLEGLMLFSGTMAGLFSLTYSDAFDVCLDDPVLQRQLWCRYAIKSVEGLYRNGKAEIA